MNFSVERSIKIGEAVEVAIVILNFNSTEHTVKCIDSIVSNTDRNFPYEIIVVDNNSFCEEWQKLDRLKTQPKVKVVRSRVNLGFGGGMMFGIQFCRANYYFFLNNDCLFLNDCLEPLYRFCRENNGVGICTPQMYDTSIKPVPSFDFFPTISARIFGKGVHRLTRRYRFSDRSTPPSGPVRVDVPSGSQLFMPAEVFHSIGGFDTNLFLYCEEEDLALRISKLGLGCFIVPGARNLHIGGASTPKSAEIQREFYISFFYLYRKHYGLLPTLLLWVHSAIRCIKKALKGEAEWSLVSLVVRGAGLKHSMRFKQKISN